MNHEGLDFFSCIARRRGNLDPTVVHKHILQHFKNILFTSDDDGESIAPFGRDHPAIKTWIKKCGFPDNACDKLIKGAALRFLHYHRDYVRKPGRLFCKHVFALLVVDMWGVAVGYSPAAAGKASGGGGTVQWINPLESTDYYLLCDHGNGRFSIVDEEEMMSLIDPGPARFMLRKYSVVNLGGPSVAKGDTGPSNHPIGPFVPFPDDGRIHYIDYEPLPKRPGEESDMYQLYPLDETKTFYTIPTGHAVFVYLVGKLNRKLELVAYTEYHDQYLYWPMTELTRGVVVVVAKSAKEAEELARV